MQLEMIVLSEVRKRKTDTIWYHICVEPKIRHKVNISTTQKQTHKHREQTVIAQGEAYRGGMDREFGISRGKLVCRGWINNRSCCIAQGTIFHIL